MDSNKILVICLLSLIAPSATSQEEFKRLLLADPYRANGIFILDKDLRDSLDVSTVIIQVNLHNVLSDDSYSTTLVQTLEIGPEEFYAQADQSILELIDEGGRLSYHLNAFNSANELVDEWTGLADPQQPWPERCRMTCNSSDYAWSAVCYSDNVQCFIDFVEGTTNGSYFYFYVKASEWGQFTQQYLPGDFGFAYNWNSYFAFGGPDPGDRLLLLDESLVPSDARDISGLPIGPNPGDCYAVYKSKGQWLDFVAATNPFLYSLSHCAQLDVLYNADANIQSQLALNSLPPINCAGGVFNASGGALEWGEEDYVDCSNQWDITYEILDNEIDIVQWAIETIDCTGGWDDPLSPGTGIGGIAGLIVSKIEGSGTTTFLSISMKNASDPRLIEVPKTELPAGLYRYTVVGEQGQMLHVYSHQEVSIIANANFASFTQIAVYPVPVVANRCSIDLDLPAPISGCPLTIVNAMGVPYYQVVLDFPHAGLNKHVVDMNETWPSGNYYGMITYQDGSVDSFGLLVD